MDKKLFHGNSLIGSESDKPDPLRQSADVDFTGGLIDDVFLHEKTAFDVEYFNAVVSG